MDCFAKKTFYFPDRKGKKTHTWHNIQVRELNWSAREASFFFRTAILGGVAATYNQIKKETD